MANESEANPALRIKTDRKAEFDIADAVQYLLRFPGGEELAARFSEVLDAAITEEGSAVAAQIVANGRPDKRIDVAASAYNSRPTFRLDVQTARRRARCSGSGLWFVFYTLDNPDGDNKPGTLTVHAVHHSRAEPFAINTGQFDLPDDDGGGNAL